MLNVGTVTVSANSEEEKKKRKEKTIEVDTEMRIQENRKAFEAFGRRSRTFGSLANFACASSNTFRVCGV